MAKHEINAGATSQRFYIYLQNSTTGQGQTGVTSATCYYLRDAVSGTMPAALTLTFGAVFASPGTYPTWTSGGVREIGYMPGLYLIDIPDAVFAAGARNAVVQIFPVTGSAWLPVNLEFTLAAVNIYNAVNMGITALPNTAVTTNGSLLTSGTGTAQISTSGGAVSANTTQWGGTAVTGMPMPTYTQPIGFLAATFPTTVASTTNITAGTITTVSGNVNGSVNSVATAVTANTTQWGGTAVTGMPMPTYTQPSGFLAASFPTTVASPTNITAGTITTVSGNVNGNVAGSVGSVTGNVSGSVGSVTGNVSGNVVGSVNSVATAVTVGTINANVVNASALATDAITEIWSKAATDSSYGTSSTYTMLDVIALLGRGYCPVYGTVVGSPAPTQNGCKTSLTGYVNSAFDDQTIIFLQGGVISGSCTVISSSNASGTLTFDEPLHQAPNVGDAFMILPMHVHLRGAIADKLLGRTITGAADGGRMVKDALRALRNKSAIVGSTLTVYQEDDTTAAWTASVSSSATADPVTGIDPA